MENAREQIFDIVEEMRTELEEIGQGLELARAEVQQQIEVVENLQREDRESRRVLLVMTRNREAAGSERIREAYQQASEIQWRLQAAMEREQQLRRLRDSMERRYRRLERIMKRAEGLVSQVGLALGVFDNEPKADITGTSVPADSRAFAFALIKTQEEERRHLAREIHDGPAQLLANVSIRLQTTKHVLSRNQEEAQRELEELGGIVRQSLQDVRRIIFNLRTVNVDELGLIGGLRVLIAELEQRTGLQCDLQIEAPKDFDCSTFFAITVIRIVQEALNNVVRHAGVMTAAVAIEVDGHSLHVTVRDEGRGMGPEQLSNLPASAHFGLETMRERVSLLGGTMNIDSAIGQGTTVHVVLPLGGGEPADYGKDSPSNR